MTRWQELGDDHESNGRVFWDGITPDGGRADGTVQKAFEDSGGVSLQSFTNQSLDMVFTGAEVLIPKRLFQIKNSTIWYYQYTEEVHRWFRVYDEDINEGMTQGLLQHDSAKLIDVENVEEKRTAAFDLRVSMCQKKAELDLRPALGRP